MSLADQIREILRMDIQDYHERKAASQRIDQLLGLQSYTIEQTLAANNSESYTSVSPESSNKSRIKDYKTWIGFSHQDFQTTYHEFKEILETIQLIKGSVVVDFGCAYGRLGIVTKVLFPEIKFLGFEIIPLRAAEAVRVNQLIPGGHVEVRSDNLVSLDFVPPEADLYFIYDFSDKSDLKVLLEKLRQKAQNFNHPIRLVA